MKIITISLKKILILLIPLAFNQAMAASEKEVIEKAHIMPQKHKNHSKHIADNSRYRGVYYGVHPCKDCKGVKVTLSLKNRSNYLLVTQPAKSSAREYFEKGKYIWDDEAQIVTLTPRKNLAIRKYQINDEKTLTELSSKGIPLTASQQNTSYVLRKDAMTKKSTSSIHMH